MTKPAFDQHQQKRYDSQDLSNEELDYIYHRLILDIRHEVDHATKETLTQQNFADARYGSLRWLKVQRMVVLSKLYEAEDLARNAELGQ